MGQALEQHDRVLLGAIVEAGGSVFKHTGDGCAAVFSAPVDAVVAAATAQRALAGIGWGELGELRVRMGVHVGEAMPRDGDWFGPALNRCARLMGLAHGGQVLVSRACQALLDVMPADLGLRDLGVHRLRDLAQPEHVWQLTGSNLASEFPPLRSLDTFRGRLPSRLSPFVGREREQRDIKKALTATRLLTLVGPGGMGKTRLGLHVAAGVVDRFAQGVWFVELAPVGESSALDHAVAATLGFQSQQGQRTRELLVEGLSHWHALLVFDNCEHLLSPVGEFIADLVGRCPNLSVLATSRAPLRIEGERVWQVGPLDLEVDAPALFEDRASAARAGFSLDDHSEPLVKAICAHLDGMPLAIELAAARLRSMTVLELLDGLGQRFRLLRADRGVSTGRHATLAAVIDWSYELLAPEAKRLLLELGIFAGGFELGAAHAIRTMGQAEACDQFDTLDMLDTLVDHSLVQADELDGRTRYSMLETLRQYAASRWSDEDRADLQARHAAYYLGFARAADERLRGPEQAHWLGRLETEHDNLRAALAWTLGPDGDPSTGLGLTAALWWFWRVRSHIDEGRRWYAQALAMPPRADSTSDRVRALTGAGLLGYFARSYDPANSVLARARDEASRANDDFGAGWALHGLGRVALDQRDYSSASTYFEESIRVFRKCGEIRGIAYSTYFAGSAASFGGDPPTAERYFDEAENTLRALGDIWGLVGVAGVRAWHAITVRDKVGAARRFGEQLSGSAQIDSKWMVSLALFGLARTAAVTRRWALSVQLYGSARAVCAAMGAQADAIGGTSEGRYMQEARAALGAEAVDSAWVQGRSRTINEAVTAGLAAASELAGTGPSEAAAHDGAGLTSQEWAVLGLAAAGRTNQEIAEQLALSVRTVENHMAHVYRKLGVHSRAEATRFALEAAERGQTHGA